MSSNIRGAFRNEKVLSECRVILGVLSECRVILEVLSECRVMLEVLSEIKGCFQNAE